MCFVVRLILYPLLRVSQLAQGTPEDFADQAEVSRTWLASLCCPAFNCFVAKVVRRTGEAVRASRPEFQLGLIWVRLVFTNAADGNIVFQIFENIFSFAIQCNQTYSISDMCSKQRDFHSVKKPFP